MLEVGIDSYVTLEDANAYLEAYGPPNAFVTEQDLRRATLAIDRLYGSRFLGYSAEPGQPLFFPVFGSEEIPLRVAQATAELAYLMSEEVGFDPYTTPEPSVISISKSVSGVASKTVTYAAPARVDPLHRVNLILGPLFLTISAGGGLTFIDVLPAI